MKEERLIMKPDSYNPKQFPYNWCSEWGEDLQGPWIAFTVKGVRQVLRWIPPGKFQMGSPVGELERGGDEIFHDVIISQGFWLAETACTQELWQIVMGGNPANFQDGPDYPVEQVSWNDCVEFIARINSMVDGLNVRLPTEAEWEYSCRAGTQTPFSFGETITPEQVNYDGNYPYANAAKGKYRERTAAVKSFPNNGWGLYEMHGNVWEWCSDWYDKYEVVSTPSIDPVGPLEGSRRVLRGGSCFNSAGNCRSACRNWYPPSLRFDGIGFRLARGQ